MNALVRLHVEAKIGAPLEFKPPAGVVRDGPKKDRDEPDRPNDRLHGVGAGRPIPEDLASLGPKDLDGRAPGLARLVKLGPTDPDDDLFGAPASRQVEI
ncbi:MAG TPA: hypothetical protein VM694_38450 [Polyangium sp.]|nr:hypothetical protein [Polyangium sp.]